MSAFARAAERALSPLQETIIVSLFPSTALIYTSI